MARAQNVMFLDLQIDGSNFWGGLKHFQESVGGKYKTWLGSFYDILKLPKKLYPYCNTALQSNNTELI